jgi:ATP-dependent helicase/nuclease subunit B
MLHVATIPPDRPFLDTLAARLLDQASDEVELVDTLVLLPTRRGCRGLRDAFLRGSDRPALLLPRIQPIGEVDSDELLLDGTLEVDLPPALPRLRRTLLLARLLRPLEPQVEHALRLADELARLLDELQTERVPLARIETLVPDAFARHWERAQRVLATLAGHWPGWVESLGATEPAERRDRVLAALAARWRTSPPRGRVVAAGSTGSIQATRALLHVIARLPNGEVVLPGLDRELDAASWQALPPTHPQYGLKQLLEALDCPREAVVPWTEEGDRARSRLLQEVMRPAPTIAAWQQIEIAPLAVRGLGVVTAPDPAAEALQIALRLRAALEVPGRTAALVTPDRALARRVAVELGRWQIEIDDSAGVPLDQTPPGAFLLLTAHLVQNGIDVVGLLSVLKHPFARLGREPATLRSLVRRLEITCLRGPRLAGGFTGILTELGRAERRPVDEAGRARLAELRKLVDDLARLAAPLFRLTEQPEAELGALLEAHLAFAEALSQAPDGTSPLWVREAGEAAADVFAELLETGREGYPVPAGGYPILLAHALRQRPVRPKAPRHPRLHIWGQLEARLQQADLLILGGLNEGVWPAAVDPGPWLNATMRAELGLPPSERAIGLAAHDFVQAAASAEVVLSRAEKDHAGSPTVPSRWLVRLETLLEAQGLASLVEADGLWNTLAARIDRPAAPPRPAAQPRPCPPLEARPRQLAVSDIALWMQNPYDLYAKRILALRALEPLDADPGALERGIVIHRALERFVRAHPDALPPDAETRLLALGRQAFEPYAHRPEVRALWWPRFERVASWFVGEERERRPRLVALRAEVPGRLVFETDAGPFVLEARADRIERLAGGGLAIVDYKTGALPQKRDVASGRQPQLSLEGAIALAGGFEGTPPEPVEELVFWQLRGGETPAVTLALSGVDVLIEGARAGLERLVRHFDDPAVGYLARLRPSTAPRRDYDHLARQGEWPG